MQLTPGGPTTKSRISRVTELGNLRDYFCLTTSGQPCRIPLRSNGPEKSELFWDNKDEYSSIKKKALLGAWYFRISNVRVAHDTAGYVDSEVVKYSDE